MTLEANAEQVKNLALMPIGSGEHRRYRRHRRFFSRELHSQADTLFPLNREKLIVHFKAGIKGKAIDDCYVRKECKPKRRLLGQIIKHGNQVLSKDNKSHFASEFNQSGDCS